MNELFHSHTLGHQLRQASFHNNISENRKQVIGTPKYRKITDIIEYPRHTDAW